MDFGVRYLVSNGERWWLVGGGGFRRSLVKSRYLKAESVVIINGQPEIDRNSHKTYGLINLG